MGKLPGGKSGGSGASYPKRVEGGASGGGISAGGSSGISPERAAAAAGLNKLSEGAAKACKAAKWKKESRKAEENKNSVVSEVGSKNSASCGKESNEKIFKE